MSPARSECDFWTSDARRNGGPRADNAKLVEADGRAPEGQDDLRRRGRRASSPGITAHEAFGHSPGHLIFKVHSGGQELWLTADTANHFVASLQRPDWEVRFDMDKADAAATRKRVFDAIADGAVPFLGYHMPFPAVGYVEKRTAAATASCRSATSSTSGKPERATTATPTRQSRRRAFLDGLVERETAVAAEAAAASMTAAAAIGSSHRPEGVIAARANPSPPAAPTRGGKSSSRRDLAWLASSKPRPARPR